MITTLYNSLSFIFRFLCGYKPTQPNRRQKFSQSLHQRKIQASLARLETLKRIGLENGLPAQLNYLRKVDPIVFEEMILSAIESKSHKVIRNSRYTGDGGIDGIFEIKGVRYLVQAKRYTGHINASDVSVFNYLCKNMNLRGLFVHTGKTGGGASAAAGDHVEIVSGKKLMELLLPVTPRSQQQ